ncbi:glucokinase [Francisella orientalis]|uniref:Glucokinase n=1 Tax=Francisella orientalis TaxID=299583 RepID=A0AAP7C5F7_9GAMM|nr:glucokinase [Francisella orientalis]AFJ42976.1 glucokinase [Francisella orientalis str. Toba 04]AHB98073.1 glucokinase [Francisella orientalis LADL 07-285A]AKN85207.1 Glucokinase [Francisella orientalis FNO12]AKN86746.1 Glucokinase [Francisella orientalis FNO24]AKN88285.1 Glucokinase [Francisella orientalis]
MYILSGDIGGTNTRLEVSLLEDGLTQSIAIRKYKGANFNCLSDIIDKFLLEVDLVGQIDSVCLAVAGFVANGEVQVTNLPWLVSEQYISEGLGIDKSKVKVINDFEAIGYGIESLDREKDLITLQDGKKDDKTLCAVVGAGTGLGMCLVSYDKDHNPRVYKTEGGHVDFSPVDDEQIQLFRFMRRTFHRISPERFCSGYGIFNIYKYVVRNPLYDQLECQSLRRELFSVSDSDKAAVIVKYAIEHREPSALRTIDIFLSIYGSVAGNLALSSLPFRGLYIAGGIAPRLIKQIKESKFLEKFRDKGRMSSMMKDFPVHIIMNTDVGLIGARTYAAGLVKVE